MKIGRNDPCPCGSGRKYKKCCLAADESVQRGERQEQQQRLWAEDGEAASEDGDDSPGDLIAEDVPPFDVSGIRRIAYSSGFVQTADEAYGGEGLVTTVWTAPDIPAAILECLEREAVAELDGEWGDTASGTPIQVDEIDLQSDDDMIGVVVFNRAILLAFENTDDTRRLHRVCSALEEAAKQRGTEPNPATDLERLDARSGRRRAAIDFDALLKAHRKQGGTCELCGMSLTRRGAARHLHRCAPNHDSTKDAEQPLVHLRVTAPGAPAYWLDLEARGDARLEALDRFLRNTWLECCGHLSQFRTDSADYFSAGYEFGLRDFPGFSARRPERRMTSRVGEVLSDTGDRVIYEYDFGSTTQLLIAVAGQRRGRIGRRAVRLLARNTPPDWPCERCGAPAVSVCASCWGNGEYGAVCRAHERSHDCDEPSFLPAANSPRVGVCGYAGE